MIFPTATLQHSHCSLLFLLPPNRPQSRIHLFLECGCFRRGAVVQRRTTPFDTGVLLVGRLYTVGVDSRVSIG